MRLAQTRNKWGHFRNANSCLRRNNAVAPSSKSRLRGWEGARTRGEIIQGQRRTGIICRETLQFQAFYESCLHLKKFNISPSLFSHISNRRGTGKRLNLASYHMDRTKPEPTSPRVRKLCSFRYIRQIKLEVTEGKSHGSHKASWDGFVVRDRTARKIWKTKRA